MEHIRTLDFIAIALYCLAMLWIGWWSSRRGQSAEGYFVAGRNANPLMVGLSMTATLLSTISYLTMPGELIRNGPGLMWGMVSVPIIFIVVGYFVIPHIMKQKVTSGYELLEICFGLRIRQTGSFLFVLARVPWMAFIIYTCSNAVATITGAPLYLLLLAIGILTTIYTVMGGIRAVILTDVVQFIILLGGGILVIAFATFKSGGLFWPDWSSPQLSDLHWPSVKTFSLNPADRVTIFGAIVASSAFWICTAVSDQMMIQRYLCTRDARAARRSFLHCLVGDFFITQVLWLIGFAVLGFFVRFPEYLPDRQKTIAQQADNLFPHMVGAVLPAGLCGLIVAALLAAAMSSLASGINSTATVLMTDFKSIFARNCPNDEMWLVRRAKVIGLFVGIFAILLSYCIGYVPGRNLFEVGFRISFFFTAPLSVLFFMAFFVPFSTPEGGWAAIIVGFLSGLLFSYWQQIIGSFTTTFDFSIILILPLSIICSFLAGASTSLLTMSKRRLAKSPWRG